MTDSTAPLTPEQRARLARLTTRPRHPAARSRLTATVLSSLAAAGLVGTMLGSEAAAAPATDAAVNPTAAAPTPADQGQVIVILPDGRLALVERPASPSQTPSQGFNQQTPVSPSQQLGGLPRTHGSR